MPGRELPRSKSPDIGCCPQVEALDAGFLTHSYTILHEKSLDKQGFLFHSNHSINLKKPRLMKKKSIFWGFPPPPKKKNSDHGLVERHLGVKSRVTRVSSPEDTPEDLVVKMHRKNWTAGSFLKQPSVKLQLK